MLRHSKLALCLWILAIALTAMRMSGAHLHLCSDGQEAAAAVHLVDASPHHAEDEAAGEHDDRDLSISSAAIFKKSDTGADLVALAFTLILLLIFPRPRAFVPAARVAEPPHRLVPYFTPPLRGPPL